MLVTCILYDWYNRICNYLFPSITFNNPAHLDKVANPELYNSYRVFKQDENEFSKLMFILNNMPAIVHKLLFDSYKNVCSDYFQITYHLSNPKDNDIGKSTHEIELSIDNFEELLKSTTIRYYYIRVNLMIPGEMNHVNCIIIDKEKRYILYFEPMYNIRVNIDAIKSLLYSYGDLSSYTFLLPTDIGYNFINRLQKFDFFCQTYVIYSYLLIINNDHVNTNDFSSLLNDVITTRNMGYFLYDVYRKYKDDNREFWQTSAKWSFPTNDLMKVINTIRQSISDADDGTYQDEYDEATIEEVGDILVFQRGPIRDTDSITK